MEIKFLGRGGAFNTPEGNTSAYFKENESLFLIDCGETVFESLINNHILDDVNNIYVFITHTHSDHIGSLGSLIHYSYYVKNAITNIIIPTNPRYLNDIESLLKIFGCENIKYNYVFEKELDNKNSSFNKVRYMETTHTPLLDCYGILFDTNEGYIYYSGDTNEVSNVEKLIEENKKIDKLYMDTTTADYPGNVHLNINILDKKIPSNIKSKVYCMHLSDNKCIDEARKLGFNVVNVNNK